MGDDLWMNRIVDEISVHESVIRFEELAVDTFLAQNRVWLFKQPPNLGGRKNDLRSVEKVWKDKSLIVFGILP